MTSLSPEQWRVLDYLYQHKLHTVQPKLTHVRKAQKVSDDDLIELIARGLVIPLLGTDEIPEQAGKLPRLMQTVIASHIQLRLSAAGLRTVLDDPGNQIRYTLGQHSGPVTLTKLFDGNSIVIDDVTHEQARRLISVVLPDFGEFELSGRFVLFGEIFKVTLTPKGREYLPL